MLRLTVEGSGAQFVLTGQDALIGRGEHCDILLEVDTVSARHGVCRSTAGGYTYTDLGSKNGSALQRGDERMALSAGREVNLIPGDVLLLGDAEPPLRILVDAGVSPFAAAPSLVRTRVARTPLADLLHAPPQGLPAFAARVLDSKDGTALAQCVGEYVRTVFGQVGLQARLIIKDETCEFGDDLPAALSEFIKPSREVARLSDVPDVGHAIVVPLLAHEAYFGTVTVWSPSALRKPCVDALEVAASLVGLACAGLHAKKAPPSLETGGDPIGSDPKFVRVLDLCRRVAGSEISILITGETGTGKEVLARAVHTWGPRREGPFVAINCAAIPAGLLESELFGHVKGAFTGAASDRPGVFERTAGGTLLLDEIGEMPLELQARLLRVVEDQEVRPVGGDRAKPVDVRILAATHRDLEAMVAAGKFREDLMYRINTVTVRLPPLRERGDDVVLLANHLLDERSARAGKRLLGFTPEALWILMGHEFRGNVRELRNEIDRAVALTLDGEAVVPTSFSERLVPQALEEEPQQARTLKACLSIAERFAVETALARHDGNVTRAAEELGLSRAGLHKILSRLGLR